MRSETSILPWEAGYAHHAHNGHDHYRANPNHDLILSGFFDMLSGVFREGNSVAWVTKRSHLQVSKAEVLPIIFKARRSQCSSDEVESVPPAFPETEAYLSDCLPVLREWLTSRVDRMHRSGAMNVKPGALETPAVLRYGSFMFTLWFEPTAAFFSVLHAKGQYAGLCQLENGSEARNDMYIGLNPTSQTLVIVAEKCK